MEQSRPRRKSYLVNRKLQLELGLMVTTVTLALSSAVFAMYSKYVFSLLVEISEGVDPAALARQAEEQARTGAVLGLAAIGILALVCIAFSLRRSHRVAGPLLRLEKHLDLLLQGKFETRTRLRRDDELQGIIEKLNRLSEQMQNPAQAPQDKQ